MGRRRFAMTAAPPASKNTVANAVSCPRSEPVRASGVPGREAGDPMRDGRPPPMVGLDAEPASTSAEGAPVVDGRPAEEGAVDVVDVLVDGIVVDVVEVVAGDDTTKDAVPVAEPWVAVTS